MITPEGDYLSNLQAPDLRKYFRHLHWRVMGHSMGHLVASDWADKAEDDPVFGIYKKCGLWTRDEAAILYNVARIVGGRWLDIGSHSGWTSAHIKKAGTKVVAMVDPLYKDGEYRGGRFGARAVGNMEQLGATWWIKGMTAHDYFASLSEAERYDGVCIDGDHEPGKPLEDAQNAARHLADTGVIMLHDFIGQPVREAVTWLMDHGFKARVYWTPHLVACCWRGDFTPPDHEPDGRIDWLPHLEAMSKDFDFRRLS